MLVKLLLVGSGLIAVMLAGAGFMLVMSSDSAGRNFNADLFVAAWITSMAAPIVGFIATLVLTIMRVSKGRPAIWIPIAGTAIFVATFCAAVALVFYAVKT